MKMTNILNKFKERKIKEFNKKFNNRFGVSFECFDAESFITDLEFFISSLIDEVERAIPERQEISFKGDIEDLTKASLNNFRSQFINNLNN